MLRNKIQLLLVDLENLLHDHVGPLPTPSVGPSDSDKWLESTGSLSPMDASRAPSPCVVVFAFNLKTGNNPHIDFTTLRDFAERLSRVVGQAPLAGFEIALTLPIKQSADKALERLFYSAPLAEHAGSLASVYVLTRDDGLRNSIDKQLSNTKYELVKYKEASTFAWTLRGKNKGVQRQPPPRPSPSPVLTTDVPTDHAQAIDTPALAAWAQGQPVQLPAGSLPQLVARVRQRPGLLTQVGLTCTSVRGLARMDGLARQTIPRLGPCTAEEGVELCSDDVGMGNYTEPAASSLGPGVIRLRTPRPATAHTLLPPAVAMAVDGALEIGADAAINDARALAKVSLATLMTGPPFKVRLQSRSHGVAAEITSPFGVPIAAWWKGSKTKTDSTKTVKGLEAALTGSLTIHAISDVTFVGRDRALVVRAPFRDAVMVELKQPLEASQLGAGKVGTVQVAVLGREDRVEHSMAVRCQPIQELSDGALRAAYPNLRCDLADLKQLPFMVPI